MPAETIIHRLVTRANKNLQQDESVEWEAPTEIYEPPKGLETINTELVSKDTIMVCLTCGFRNRLKNARCVKCDYQIP